MVVLCVCVWCVLLVVVVWYVWCVLLVAPGVCCCTVAVSARALRYDRFNWDVQLPLGCGNVNNFSSTMKPQHSKYTLFSHAAKVQQATPSSHHSLVHCS